MRVEAHPLERSCRRGDGAMRSVRVVKRGEREAANNSPAAEGARVVQQSTPEIVSIVKSWISESRERRQTEAAEHRLGLQRWRESAS